MVMEAWPSISETTFALTPSLKSSVGERQRRTLLAPKVFRKTIVREPLKSDNLQTFFPDPWLT
jgi:hypothetical protein